MSGDDDRPLCCCGCGDPADDGSAWRFDCQRLAVAVLSLQFQQAMARKERDGMRFRVVTTA